MGETCNSTPTTIELLTYRKHNIPWVECDLFDHQWQTNHHISAVMLHTFAKASALIYSNQLINGSMCLCQCKRSGNKTKWNDIQVAKKH